MTNFQFSILNQGVRDLKVWPRQYLLPGKVKRRWGWGPESGWTNGVGPPYFPAWL
jgi:hypothetical protein